MLEAVGQWGGGAVWRVTSGEFPSNAYACALGDTKTCFVIDPGLDGPAIDAALKEQGLRPVAVLCTHGHFDHAGSAAYFQRTYDCPVHLHRADEKIIKASNFLLMAFKLRSRVEQPAVTWVAEAATLEVTGQRVRFIPAPGHTPGSCVIEIGNAWFTGDTIYGRGVGLSKLPGEDATVLRATIRALWPELTRERTIFPGHGECFDGETVRLGNRALIEFVGTERP